LDMLEQFWYVTWVRCTSSNSHALMCTVADGENPMLAEEFAEGSCN